MSEQHFEARVGDGTLAFSTGRLAQQANASVLARFGGTEVLATVVMPEEIREDVGYFPLMVDYEEKLYAAGKIKGSRFIKHEGRPTDEAILSARLVDRAIRPLFPSWLKNDVQIVLTVLSFDKENDPDMVGLNAAVAALSISNIPWEGPIAGVRVSKHQDAWVINPSYAIRKEAQLNLVVAGTSDKTLMIEADANEATEETVFEGVALAQKQLAPILAVFGDMQKKIGLQKKTSPEAAVPAGSEDSSAIDPVKEAEQFIDERIQEALFTGPKETKSSRKQTVKKLIEDLDEHLKELQVGKEKRATAADVAEKRIERVVSDAIIQSNKRVDGRSLDEIRPLDLGIGILSRTHGSGLFGRGETQVLSVVTLDSPGSEQILDTLEEDDTKKRYMHHYNFPPFSVGEARPLRGPGRRDIGHGALAEKALVPMLPSKEDFPYTIRVVSEVLGSNGSSSMGSVCGSTLSLLHAGVPIRKSVAGIAMGLASDDKGNYKILTDLQDLEDGPGGMDFKVAGSRDGITAVQLDTKTKGLSNQIVQETLAQAKQARIRLLDAMDAVIAKPGELSEYAPRIVSMHIDPEKIRIVIGPGGKMINEIIDETGVDIDIDDDGLVMITSDDPAGAQRAQEWIELLTKDIEPGQKYEGKVTRIMDFGAFVEIAPNKEGLVHISNLAQGHVNKVEDLVSIGDTLPVEVVEIDDMDRINLKVQGVERQDHARREGRPDSRDRGQRGRSGPPHRGGPHRR